MNKNINILCRLAAESSKDKRIYIQVVDDICVMPCVNFSRMIVNLVNDGFLFKRERVNLTIGDFKLLSLDKGRKVVHTRILKSEKTETAQKILKYILEEMSSNVVDRAIENPGVTASKITVVCGSYVFTISHTTGNIVAFYIEPSTIKAPGMALYARRFIKYLINKYGISF